MARALLRRLPPAREARPRGVFGSRGYTMLEIVVSMLITAIMVSAVFSLSLTAKRGNVMSDRKVIASAAERQLATQLHDFTTTYWNYATNSWYANYHPGSQTELNGPASGTTGQGSWEWTNFPSPGVSGVNVCDSCSTTNPATPGVGCGACYALANESACNTAASPPTYNHYLTNYLPAWFENPPYNARASYCVSAGGGSAALRLMAPQVSIAVTWTEPSP